MLKSFQNLAYYQSVCFDVFAIDKNVVHVHHYLTISYQVHEYQVHEGLEGGQTVCHAKVHYSWLKQSSVRDNSSLPFVTFLDKNVVIPPPDIKFGEVLCLCQSIDYVCCQGEWIPICNGDFIKSAIVLDEPKFSIFFLDEENW